MTKPWVKRPADLLRWDPALARASFEVQAVFERLFAVARREDPLLGYLVAEDLRPLSIRRLAAATAVPRASLHRSRRALIETGLLMQDLAGRTFVPLVIRVERAFASGSRTRSAQRDFPDATSPTSTPRDTGLLALPGLDGAGMNPVDNRAGPGPPGGGRRPTAGRYPPNLGHPGPSHIEDLDLQDLQTETKTNTLGASRRREVEDVQNPEQPSGLEPSEIIDHVPPAITDPDVRYLLAKLAASSGLWRSVLVSAYDRHTLKRLWGSHPRELHQALQQAARDPGKIERPGAWLNRVVPTYGQVAV